MMRASGTEASPITKVTIHWPKIANEHGEPMLWFGSWLVGDSGVEGGWFYSGRGGDVQSYDVPGQATGMRIRRWPNEGLDAEYADVADMPAETISADDLDFDTRQAFSRFPDFE